MPHDLKPKPPHIAPKAKAVIQLFMQGGPSQVDLFDYKPALEKYHGQPVSKDLGVVLEDPKTAGGLMRSPFKFARYGGSGLWVSELLPHLARQVDDLVVIRSMFNSHPNHEPALFKIQSGKLLPGLPSLGAWVVYGLGSENESLPAYVVLDDPQDALPTNGVQNWQSGYLPPIYQGTRMRPTDPPILNLSPELAEPPEVVRLGRELLGRLDAIHRRSRPGEARLDARLAGYELAARMQLTAGEALDLSGETPETLRLYGVDEPATDSYARRCLMARRLVERGVRFVQVYTRKQMWDHHGNIGAGLREACRHTDQPVAALLADLKRRGLLSETLVVWGGEFGRLPMAELRPGINLDKAGRDRGPAGFTLWMAGGGLKGGLAYGATDEIGYRAVENPVSVADWHATVLHLLGLHHQQLFYERQGLRERLTGVETPRPLMEIVA